MCGEGAGQGEAWSGLPIQEMLPGCGRWSPLAAAGSASNNWGWRTHVDLAALQHGSSIWHAEWSLAMIGYGTVAVAVAVGMLWLQKYANCGTVDAVRVFLHSPLATLQQAIDAPQQVSALVVHVLSHRYNMPQSRQVLLVQTLSAQQAAIRCSDTG